MLRVVIGLTLIALAATGTVGWWVAGRGASPHGRRGLVPTVFATGLEHPRNENHPLKKHYLMPGRSTKRRPEGCFFWTSQPGWCVQG